MAALPLSLIILGSVSGGAAGAADPLHRAFACQPQGSSLVLIAVDAPSGESKLEQCDPVALPLPISAVRWAAWLPEQGPEVRDGLLLSGTGRGAAFAPTTVAVRELDPLRPLPEALPTEGDRSRSTGLGLLAAERANPESLPTSAWAWKPGLWRDEGSALLDRARSLGLSRLFVTVEIIESAVAEEDRLAAFISESTRAGIAIVAVEGDPGMALEDGRTLALRRLRAIDAYQRRSPPGARLAGVQYDIEPYLLPLFGTYPERVLRGWAETLDALAAAGSELGFDMVLPFWLAENEAAARIVLPAIRKSANRLTIMAYRTSAAEIVSAAEPLLVWGAQVGLPVHIALEAGPLDDEATRLYRKAHIGELWLAPQPDGRSLALLLHDPRVGLADQVYAFGHETIVPGRHVSFLGDQARMMAIAADAAPALRAWPSFAGFAFHGLIE